MERLEIGTIVVARKTSTSRPVRAVVVEQLEAWKATSDGFVVVPGPVSFARLGKNGPRNEALWSWSWFSVERAIG